MPIEVIPMCYVAIMNRVISLFFLSIPLRLGLTNAALLQLQMLGGKPILRMAKAKAGPCVTGEYDATPVKKKSQFQFKISFRPFRQRQFHHRLPFRTAQRRVDTSCIGTGLIVFVGNADDRRVHGCHVFVEVGGYAGRC